MNFDSTENLWKYCSVEQYKKTLISFRLFSETSWTEEKQVACLYALSNRTKKQYIEWRRPKRNGSVRILSIPNPLLKLIQKNILCNILNEMPISPHATAYRKGGGIILNAQFHVQKKQILKLDIENFFSAISFQMVYQSAFPKTFFPPAIRGLLTHLCCYKDCLPQGAPTSAMISNLVMKPFDDYVGSWCSKRGITYTRYCDDMIFSGDNFNTREVKKKVQSFLFKLGFNLNEYKTKVLTQNSKQLVTGLVVNKKVQVPIRYRKELRRELYYCHRYGVLSHLTRIDDQVYLPLGELAVKKYLYCLLGKINFVLSANASDAYFREAKVTIKHLLLA